MPKTRTMIIISLVVVGILAGVVLYKRMFHPPAAAITINILGEDSSNLQAMAKLKSDFEEEQKRRGNNVLVHFEPASFEDAQEKASNSLRNGSSEYDIVLEYNFTLADYASHGYIYRPRELNPKVAPLLPFKQIEQVEGSLFENIWKEIGWYYKPGMTTDQNIEPIGYPFAANTILLVYNEKFFSDPALRNRYRAMYGAELAPPTDWRTFKQEAAFFSSQSTNHCGVALEGKAGGWLYYEWINFLRGFGGTVMKKQYGWELGHNLELNTEVSTAATDFYASFKPYVCGDYFNIDAPVQREMMLKGNVPMALMWSDYVYELVQRASEANLTFGFAPVPGSDSLIAGGSYYINRNSKHPDTASEFVFYLLRPENQIKLAKIGLCSPVRDTYSNPDVLRLPYAQALLTSLNRASYMAEASFDADLISSGITDAVQRIWRGSPTRATLNGLQQSLTHQREDFLRKIQNEQH